MHYLIVQHTIEDYGKWRLVFDADEGFRQGYGIRDPEVFRGADSPNELLLKFRVDSLERAREFISAPDLRETMARGGVVGIPEVHFIELEQERQQRRAA